MLKVAHTFTALQPIHTGSDQNLGTLRTLRKEKVLVQNPQPIKSRFTPDQKRLKRQALALLLVRLWDKMDNKARVTIYEEVASKLLASTAVRTKEEFLQTICRKLEIREVTTNDNRRFDCVDILELFDDYELLNLIRLESQYIMSMFRKIKDENIAWMKERKGKTQVAKETVFGGEDEKLRSPEVLIQDELMQVFEQEWLETSAIQAIDYVPVISGNSIRGMLRRMVMYDFCKLADITNIEPSIYHQLFTGGTINDGTGFEDIGRRFALINTCPMLGLFGSAVGNQTLQGELKVGQAKLKCTENNSGTLSYHDCVEIIFATRLDSSKLENTINIEGEDKETHQMKYEYEVYAVGSQFDHSFACTSDNPLLISAFWRMLKLFKNEPYITAKGSVGHGEIDLSNIEIAQNADELYLKHIEENKEAIKSQWSKNVAEVGTDV